MTQSDIDELEKYYTAVAPEVLAPDTGLLGRSGQQLADLPSNILGSFVHTGQAIGNLTLPADEQQAPTNIPKPYDIPDPTTFGQQAVDVLLGKLAPELGASLIPYAGVKNLGRLAGLGNLGAEMSGQAAAGAFTGIKTSPEEAVQQAILGGGLGGIAQLNHAKRLLPLAGLTAIDTAWNASQGMSGPQLATQAGMDVAMGLLPGSLDALRAGRKTTSVGVVEPPNLIPIKPQLPPELPVDVTAYNPSDFHYESPPLEGQIPDLSVGFRPEVVPYDSTLKPTEYLAPDESLIQDAAKSKTQILPEYMRSEGGFTLPPILGSIAGGTIGGALPADTPEERATHMAMGAGIGLATGHALSTKTNRIGAIGDTSFGKGKYKPAVIDKQGNITVGIDHEDAINKAIGPLDSENTGLRRGYVNSQGDFYNLMDVTREINNESTLGVIKKEPSTLVASALRDKTQPELLSVKGEAVNTPHSKLMMPAMEAGMSADPKELEHGFIDNKGNFLSRVEAEPIAKAQGLVPPDYKSGPKGMQTQDLIPIKSEGGMKKKYDSNLGGFIGIHAASTLTGAGLGGVAGYTESGGDPMGAVSGAIIGGAVGAGLPSIARRLSRSNPRITESPTLRTAGREIKSGVAEARAKPLSELAGENARGLGETVSKASRIFEQYLNVNKPEAIRVAETVAQGSNVSALRPVVETHAAFKSSGEKPNVAEKSAAKRYIKGQLIPEAKANLIIANGSGAPEVPWKVGEVTHMVSPETRTKLVEANDAELQSATSRVPKYREFIQTGRKSYNELQGDYAAGLPDSSRKDQILNSRDQHVTNTFRMFTEPNFKPKSEDIKAVIADVAARKASIGEDRPIEAYQAQVENMIQDYKAKREGYANRTYSIDPTLMYVKQDLSPAFRQMMGEHTDPEQQIIHSIGRIAPSAKQSKLVSLLSDLQDDSGIPHILDQKTWDEAIRVYPVGSPEYKKLLAYQDIPAGISKGELSGYKASRFAVDSLHPIDATSKFGMNRGIQILTNFFKQSQTNYNPARTARNFMSLPAFAIVSRGMSKLPEASSILNNKGPEYDRLLKLGVINNENISRQFNQQVNDLIVNKDLSGLSKAGRAIHEMASMLHSLPNEMNRVSAFLAAEERFSRQLGLPKEDIAVQNSALKWTDERTINYANIAPAVKIARRIPIFNVFASYASEIGRIAKNVAGDAMSGDKHAMATLAAFSLLPIGIVKAAEATMSPADQEQWKKAQALSPDYARARFRAPLGKDTKGNFRNVDFTSLIPSDALNMSARAIANMDWRALAHVNPVSGLEENPVLKTAAEMMANKDFQTQREFRGLKDIAMNAIQNFIPPYTPGLGYQAKKFEHIGEENVKTGRTDSLGGLTGNLVGLNTTTINPAVLTRGAVSEVKRAVANERAYLNDTLKMKGISDATKQRAIKKYQDAVAVILETFRNKSNL